MANTISFTAIQPFSRGQLIRWGHTSGAYISANAQLPYNWDAIMVEEAQQDQEATAALDGIISTPAPVGGVSAHQLVYMNPATSMLTTLYTGILVGSALEAAAFGEDFGLYLIRAQIAARLPCRNPGTPLVSFDDCFIEMTGKLADGTTANLYYSDTLPPGLHTVGLGGGDPGVIADNGVVGAAIYFTYTSNTNVGNFWCDISHESCFDADYRDLAYKHMVEGIEIPAPSAPMKRTTFLYQFAPNTQQRIGAQFGVKIVRNGSHSQDTAVGIMFMELQIMVFL